MRAITRFSCCLSLFAACADAPSQDPGEPVVAAPVSMSTPPDTPDTTAEPRRADWSGPTRQAQPNAADCAPRPEVCNGVDDDCDGVVDDGFELGAACAAGQGACRATGVLVCGDDGTAICAADAGVAAPERCDGVDNDCDGAVDESGGPAETNACGQCGPTPLEACNGIDDDCDGRVDEDFGLGEACAAGPGGLCAVDGVIACDPDGDARCHFDLVEVIDCARAAEGRLAVSDAATCTVVNGDVKCWGGGPLTGPDGVIRAPAGIDALEFGAPIERVAAGKAHGCVIDATKALRCWGDGDHGALGAPGDLEPGGEAHPVLPLDLDVVDVALGAATSCAVGQRGAVKCWGADEGVLGRPVGGDVGLREDELAALEALDLPEAARRVAVGADHGCMASERGRVYCWGRNDHGQLGRGDRVDRLDAADADAVDLDMPVVDLVAAGGHTCALGLDGRVKCWGSNADGALARQVADLGGDVRHMGAALPTVPLPAPAISLATSRGRTCAVDVDGTLWCWGRAASGEIRGVEPIDLGEPLVQVATAPGFTCALTAKDDRVCFGRNDFGQLGTGDAVDRAPAADGPVIDLGD